MRATSWPTWPQPTMPTVDAERCRLRDAAMLPSARSRASGTTLRQSAIMKQMVSSATACRFTPGVHRTATPYRRAASRSIMSRPTPYLLTMRRSGSARNAASSRTSRPVIALLYPRQERHERVTRENNGTGVVEAGSWIAIQELLPEDWVARKRSRRNGDGRGISQHRAQRSESKVGP